jgi:hypothetical protein
MITKNIKFAIHIYFKKYNNWLNIKWNFIIYHNVRSIKLLILNIYVIKLYKNIIKIVISIHFIKIIYFFKIHLLEGNNAFLLLNWKCRFRKIFFSVIRMSLLTYNEQIIFLITYSNNYNKRIHFLFVSSTI